MLRFLAFSGAVGLLVGLHVQAARADDASTQPTTAPTTRASRPSAAAPPRSLLEFDELTLDLGFEARYDQTRTRYDVRDPFRRRIHQSNSSRVFEETLGLESNGAIGGRDLMLFDVAARWGLSQEWYQESRPGPDRSESPDGDLLEYDLNFTIFPRGKITFNAFAKREDSRVPRAFQASLDRTYERYGFDVLFNDRTAPMRLSYEHVYDQLFSRGVDLTDDERRGHDRFEYEATWHIDDYHALNLEYTYEDRREQYSGTTTDFETQRHYAVLSDRMRFGLDRRSYWQTELRWQEESGELARDALDLVSQLRLQHTRELATEFKLQYQRDAYQGLRTDALRGEAGVIYQLDKWLTATLHGYGMHYYADESPDATEWGVIGDVSYRRENAWGEASAHLAYNLTRVDTQDGDRSGLVAGEAVTFRDPLPAYLAQRDVVLSSVYVTDAARTRTYLLGRDYWLMRRGRYTAIRRVPTGAIADGQRVLVSYRYRIRRDYDVDRQRVDWRIQQEFAGGWIPYYAGSVQDEDIDGGRWLSYDARDVHRHRIGLTYRQKRWEATGEYEYHDDSIDPYQAARLSGDAILWQTAQHQLNAKADASRFWFDGTRTWAARDTTLIDAGLSYRYLLGRQFEADASAMYRWEDDSLAGRTHGVDIETALEWKLGYFSLRFEAEYDLLYLPDAGDDSFAVWLKLKRTIPVIARGER